MIDLTGRVFGRLTVVGPASALRPGASNARWCCLCACGSETTTPQWRLTSGLSRACGCVRLGKISPINHPHRHGHAKSPTHKIWVGMISRCYQINHTSYPRYGAVGVTVCDSWKRSYLDFLFDMGERPEGLTLERLGGATTYSKENCVWATYKAQALSRKTTRWVTHEGETLCLKDWAERIGIPYLRLYKRVVYRGWDFIKAIQT